MRFFHIFWTVTLLIIFLGVIVWAFSRRRKKDFAEAAQLPLEPDDTDIIPSAEDGLEQKHD